MAPPTVVALNEFQIQVHSMKNVLPTVVLKSKKRKAHTHTTHTQKFNFEQK